MADSNKLRLLTPILQRVIDQNLINLKKDADDVVDLRGKTGYANDVFKLIVKWVYYLFINIYYFAYFWLTLYILNTQMIFLFLHEKVLWKWPHSLQQLGYNLKTCKCYRPQSKQESGGWMSSTSVASDFGAKRVANHKITEALVLLFWEIYISGKIGKIACES